jgi:hypothetical protein
MTIFIKYPPGGDDQLLVPDDWSPVAYSLDVEHVRIEVHLAMLREMFENSGNPLAAMEALHQSRLAKVYPPLWALEFLDERLVKASREGISVDRALGLNAEGLGKGRRMGPREEHKLNNRNFLFTLVVMKFEHAGLTRGQACNALSSRLARLGENEVLYVQTGFGKSKLGHMDITGVGVRKAVEAFSMTAPEDVDYIRRHLPPWSEEDRRTCLREIREDLPLGVVKRLGI